MTFRLPPRPESPKPPKLRRYEWCRLRNEFPDLPIWRAVSQRASVRVHQVVAVALRLECLANRSVPRGSVADMSIAEFAAALQLPANAVARIRAALEDPDIAWIDQDYLVDFHERNPDVVDPTAAERQRRHREKLRAARAEQSATGPPGYPPSRDVTRDTVTGHARSDQIFSSATADNADACAGGSTEGTSDEENSGIGRDPQADAQAWLATDGAKVVTGRLNDPPQMARTKIERWLRAMDGNAAALRDIIEAAQATDATPAQFLGLVTDGIRRWQQHPALPLPPRPVAAPRRGSGHG